MLPLAITATGMIVSWKLILENIQRLFLCMLENDFCTDQAWRKTDAAGVCKDMVYGSITASNPRTAFSEGQYFEGGWNLASD